jgi:hypothetical protein
MIREKANFEEITPIAYAQKQYTDRGYQFTERVKWHLENGFVISAPYLFAMGYFYKDEEKTICYLTYVCGQMEYLFSFSRNLVIDFLEFERNFNGKTKRYAFDELIWRMK